ncbi:MAG: pyrroline-5-carboxylate reductase [Oscillospiraceae bacterium]|nr:pyrroline-5-carboxylate reductase [Oscillospiraceae bacterium]
MLKETNLGFLGGGQMCEAIFSGVLKSGAMLPQQIWITDVNQERLEALHEKYGVQTVCNDAQGTGAQRVLQECAAVVISVKPQFAGELLRHAAKAVTEKHLMISIMGGVTLKRLYEMLGQETRLARVMPNTPMLVGKGVAGIALGRTATQEDKALVQELFSYVGSVYLLEEKLIDPLTGLSGCGPAYAYLFIEALADGGVQRGLSRATAQKLAAETLAGAAEMVLRTGKHPGELKDNVCSPGGGTIAGVYALEQKGFRGTVMEAVEAACVRMEEVGKKA